MVAQLLARSRKRDPLERLSPRESEVLALMAEGRTNRAIAEELFISERGVERHVTSIFAKLDLRDRAAAVVFAFDHGLVQPRHDR